MPHYRRARQKNGQYFFTVVTGNRNPVLVHEPIRQALREAIQQVREDLPFAIDAWVLLPNHMHCIWTLPEGDNGYGKRWSIIKRLVSQTVADITTPHNSLVRTAHPTQKISKAGNVGCAARTVLLTRSQQKRRESGFWQRRFWEHLIRDENDLRRHLDYIHFNPVKHNLSSCAADWPYSTFHRYVKEGMYPMDWGGNKSADKGAFGE